LRDRSDLRRFTTESGGRIDVSSQLARGDTFKFSLLLRSEDSVAKVPNTPIMLALGCWLIVNWENAPVGTAVDSAAVPWGAGL
jgi:hypothetical protein